MKALIVTACILSCFNTVYSVVPVGDLNINKEVDLFLDIYRNTSLKTYLEPMFMEIDYSVIMAKLNTLNITGLGNLHRASNATVRYADRRVILNLQLGCKNVDLDIAYKMFGYKSASLNVGWVGVSLQLSSSMSANGKLLLSDFQLTDLKDMKLNSKSLFILKLIDNDIVMNKIKSTVRDRVMKTVQQKLDKIRLPWNKPSKPAENSVATMH